MQSAESIRRAHRVEWEHMMPAENFGRQLPCWRTPICTLKNKQTKGRKCCEKVDVNFNKMEGELYNLWPAVGLVNQARANYRFAMMDEQHDFYGCDFTVDSQQRKV